MGASAKVGFKFLKKRESAEASEAEDRFPFTSHINDYITRVQVRRTGSAEILESGNLEITRDDYSHRRDLADPQTLFRYADPGSCCAER
jgi:hypothetical protein